MFVNHSSAASQWKTILINPPDTLRQSIEMIASVAYGYDEPYAYANCGFLYILMYFDCLYLFVICSHSWTRTCSRTSSRINWFNIFEVRVKVVSKKYNAHWAKLRGHLPQCGRLCERPNVDVSIPGPFHLKCRLTFPF